MFESVDYLLVSQIQTRLEFLSRNPHHLYYIFQGFCSPGVEQYLGKTYINESVKYLIDNALYVCPGLPIDKIKKPGLYITYTPSESGLYIGDYGSTSRREVVPPSSLLDFPASAIDGANILVSKSLGITKKVWVNAVIKNYNFQSTINNVYESTDYDCITLNDVIPDGTDLRSFSLMSKATETICITHSSTDNVNISLLLITSGDVSIHKLYRAIVQYCLKALRPNFEQLGLQCSSVSVSPIGVVDQADMELTTQFSVSGKVTQSWIAFEQEVPKELVVCVEAESDNPSTETVTFTGTIHL